MNGRIEINWSGFTPDDGGTEEFFCSASARPGAFPDFRAECGAVWSAYLNGLAGRGLTENTELLLRFHLSDATNQAPFLRRITGSRPGSVVEQPPCDGARLALEAWHRKARPDSPFRMWLSYGGGADGADSFVQTKRLFYELDAELRRAGCAVPENTLRTWIYCRDVDNNYSGVVRARNEYFDTVGLDRRFIASTGIGGGLENPKRLAALDALNCAGLLPGQLSHLRAEDHLSSTALYGVRFERGSRIVFGDRSQLLISGTASIDRRGEVLFPGDVRAQCRRVAENISALLAEGGASLGDVRASTVYLRDPADYSAVREELEPFFPAPSVYLRAPVCRPAWLVECECVAVNGNGDGRFPAL